MVFVHQRLSFLRLGAGSAVAGRNVLDSFINRTSDDACDDEHRGDQNDNLQGRHALATAFLFFNEL